MELTPQDIYLGACDREGVEPNVKLSHLLGSSPLFELSTFEQPLGGKKGALALASVLSSDTGLMVVKLESSELQDAGLQAVCEALERHPSVFRLDLGYNGLRALKPLGRLLLLSPSLLCVDMSGNSLAPSLLGWSPLEPLVEALSSELCRVQLLQLGNCDIGARGVEALARGLERNSSVVNLSLEENRLGPRAAVAIARLLEANSTLTALDLRHNELGDAGVLVLAPALETNTTLGCLVLWSNKIGVSGAAALAHSVGRNSAGAAEAGPSVDTEPPPALTGRGTGLEVLDVGANAIGFAGAEAFKSALGTNRNLHTLGVAACDLGPEGVIAIAEALEGNPRLRRLDLRQNEIGLAGLMALGAAMRHNSRLHDLALDSTLKKEAPMAAAMAAAAEPEQPTAAADGDDAADADQHAASAAAAATAAAAAAAAATAASEEEAALRAEFVLAIAAACSANAKSAGGLKAPRSLLLPEPPPRPPAPAAADLHAGEPSAAMLTPLELAISGTADLTAPLAELGLSATALSHPPECPAEVSAHAAPISLPPIATHPAHPSRSIALSLRATGPRRVNVAVTKL